MDAMGQIIDAINKLIKKSKSSYDTPAVVKRVEGETAFVHIPGGVEETPVKLTVNAQPGDTVQVRVSNGRASITGNSTAPPTDDKKANAAQKTATAAGRTAAAAKKEAESANKAAKQTNQYFWHVESGSEAGAHITEKPREEFEEDPDNGGGNLLARSDGIQLRKGRVTVMQLQAPGEGEATLTIPIKVIISEHPGSWAAGVDVVTKDFSGTQFAITGISEIIYDDGYRTYTVSPINEKPEFVISDRNTWFYYTVNTETNSFTITTNGEIDWVLVTRGATFNVEINVRGIIAENYIGTFPLEQKTLFKIGNGTDSTRRSNALEVDFEGNTEIAGTLRHISEPCHVKIDVNNGATVPEFYLRRSGAVYQLQFKVEMTESVAAGDNVLEARVRTTEHLPDYVVTGCAYYGKHALIGTLSPDGNLIVRNASESALTMTSPANICFTWIY